MLDTRRFWKSESLKERRKKIELKTRIEKRNDKLYIGKDEKILKDIENLVELTF
jgi:hypothetical protein